MGNTTSIQDLTPAQELALAVKLAASGHLGQCDRGGNPYILHPIKVMHYLKSDDFQLMAIAMMHDLLEDTHYDATYLVCMGFSNRVKDAVVILTKKDGQSLEEYVRLILSNFDSCRVKLADIRHNTDVRRLKGLRAKDFARMQKYHVMHTIIRDMISWYKDNPVVGWEDDGEWYEEREGVINELVERLDAADKLVDTPQM